MAWPVYSEVLLAKTSGATWTVAPVPAGMRAVIKQVTMAQWTTDACQVTLMAGGRYVLIHDFPAAVSFEAFETMYPVYAGQDVRAYHTLSNVHLTVSGYLFQTGQATQDLPALEAADDTELPPPPWLGST